MTANRSSDDDEAPPSCSALARPPPARGVFEIIAIKAGFTKIRYSKGPDTTIYRRPWPVLHRSSTDRPTDRPTDRAGGVRDERASVPTMLAKLTRTLLVASLSASLGVSVRRSELNNALSVAFDRDLNRWESLLPR